MNKQERCDSFYQMDNVVTIDITMDAEDWETLRNAEPHGRNKLLEDDHDARCAAKSYTGNRYDWFTASEVKVSGTAFPEGGPYSFERVGIKKRSFCGSFSRTKPALALDFSEYKDNEEEIEDLIGTKYITLNNSKQDDTYIRQALGYELFRQAGLPYSRCNFARVRINGEDKGFYINIEPIKKRHIQHNFIGNDAGNLYEIEIDEDFEQAMMDADRISWEGFSDFEDKADLKLATREIASGALDSVIDVNQFLRYFAMEALLKHHDGYTGNQNNTYIYNDVTAVETPVTANVNFKFIPWGLDQILMEENATFHLRKQSVLSEWVIEDDDLFRRLKDEIRSYATSILDRENYNDVLPFISKMEGILRTEVEENLTTQIDTVRKQLKLVKSGAFQLLGEFPGGSCHLLRKKDADELLEVDGKDTDEGAHASNTERVGDHYESYHREPKNGSDLWHIEFDEEAGAYTIRNCRYGTYLHASDSKYTNEGYLKVYCFTSHPHEGNYFDFEMVDNNRPHYVTGYFKIRSTRTGNYLRYSDTDLTPRGRKRIHQSDADNATIIYLF
jgi:hypothetical protein